MPNRLLNLEEVARYLHLNKVDVEALVRERTIPVEKQGDRVVFRKREIDSWASQRILGLTEKRLKAYHQGSSSKVAGFKSGETLMEELIEPDFIAPELHSKTKSSLLRDMVHLAEKTERLTTTAQDLLLSLQEREAMCSTALPGGMALLHPRHHEPYLVSESFMVLGRTIQPVHFGAPDGQPTDLFFLICCGDDRLHLHILARLSCMCLHTPLIDRLRRAEDAASLHGAILQAERDCLKTPT